MLSSQTIMRRMLIGGLTISPFMERTVSAGRSYGLASCGYDVRLNRGLWLFPFWGRLASVLEYIRMPLDLAAEIKDKSTNARLFVLVQNTFIEPGWRGHLTLELTRFKPWPIYLKTGTPIAQIVFHQLDAETMYPYNGKYQDQGLEPQKAKLEKDK